MNLYGESEDLFSYLEGPIWYIDYNVQNQYLQNRNLRLALSLAIDRSKFVENVLKNGSRVFDGFIPYDLSKSPDGLDFREINGLYFPADPAQALKEARESLAKAKEELQTESISPAFSYNNTYPSDEISQFIQSQWKRLDGGQIVMQGEESLAQSEHLSHHEFDLALAAASPDYADPITFL